MRWTPERGAWLLWTVTGLLLLVPVVLGFRLLGEPGGYWQAAVSTLGVVGLLVVSSRLLLRRRWGWAVAATLLLVVLLFVRMLFFGLIRFAGEAFGSNFFIHLEPESVRVAWQQYGWMFAVFGVVVVALVALLGWTARRLWVPSRRGALVIGLASLVLVIVGHAGAPTWRLAAATVQWYRPKQLDLPDVRMALWRKSPLVDTRLVTKQKLWAHAATPPRNLIMLYIESGGLTFAESDRYPDLMPYWKGLIARHSLVDHLHASSYITIEGIVNTQCGTLFPFEHGSDSLAGSDNLLEEMPCLGDVLSKAGYTQTYLGGADKSFAGKGAFLKAHGYDKVWGYKDWSAHGFKQRPGTWGLSDVDLFQQSIVELQRLKATGKPFNLTMLTIGTHVPGFPYKECEPYRGGHDRYLDAIHCTDQLMKRWVGELRAKHLLDDRTLLVITGDHQMFPNTHLKSLFGADAVNHRILPFVVIGRHAPATVRHGAGYDIAPTLIDLLGVRTNARFAMGRSLLGPPRKVDNFPSRYTEIFDEAKYKPGTDFKCDPDDSRRIPGLQPLSRCERKELAVILRAQARAYSAPPVRLRCDGAEPLRLALPGNGHDHFRIDVSGSEQAKRFTWHERHLTQAQPGLYLVALNRKGVLLDRWYAPPDAASRVMAEKPAVDGAALWVFAWLPGKTDAPLPGWTERLVGPEEATAGIFTVGSSGAPVVRERLEAGQALTLSSRQCKALVPGN